MVADLPVDIIMDVARAADPARFRAAVSRLDDGGDYARAATEVALAFSETDGELAAGAVRRESVHLPFDVERARVRLGGGAAAGDVYQQFEAVTLQKFVEAMLPRESTAWFGKGFAGDMWKAMLAQQMAEEIARSGGIGIARTVEKAHPAALALPRTHGDIA